ncbi:hypothetical protein OS187_08350 [Xanthomonadaceae bacterium JHOS43]|nr:hypothetical protein [Xanthomonadaceae bacterium JHOS43]
MRLWANSFLAFTILAAFGPAADAFEPARLALASTQDDEVYFDVAGIWPDTCPPQLREVSSRGHEIRLTATRETTGCRASPTPYAFFSPALPRDQLLTGNGVHRVRFEIDGAPGEDPLLAGFALVRAGDAISGMSLESGFWWAEQGGEFGAGPGLGLSVETQGSLISLSVMGYGAHGAPAWYFGAGELADGIAHLDLGQFEGGAGPFARYAAPEEIRLSGVVDVETLTPSRAILWFSRADAGTGAIDLRPLSIMRFSFAQEPGDALLGRWLVAGAESGTRDTRWIEFVRSESLAGGFVLYDADDTAALHCDTPPGHPGSPPAICRMEISGGDAIEFTDVAFRRLSGWDSEARRTIAFRLD